MRLLSLNVGVLICDAIYIFVLDNGKSLSSKIEIFPNNQKGEEFIDMFSKGVFSAERIKKYVLSEQKFRENVQKIRDTLTSVDIKYLIKLYFISDYEEIEIDEALKIFDVLLSKKMPPVDPPDPENTNPNKESIQNWVKRIFKYLFMKNILTEEEIYRLHDLEYSKRTFGINYAMLVDREKDTVDSYEHNRYWKKKIGNYFVCSQWWLGNDDKYEYNIKRWLIKVFPDYVAYGLDRSR